jgi:kynurenine formamidase
MEGRDPRVSEVQRERPHPNQFAVPLPFHYQLTAEKGGSGGFMLSLSYGPHPKQGIDLLLPAAGTGGGGERGGPCVVFLHGGAWRTGDRSEYHGLAQRLLEERQMHLQSVALMGYRLSGDSSGLVHPAHLQDVTRGLVRLLEHLQEQGQSTQRDAPEGKQPHTPRLLLVGHSVGATLAFQCLPQVPPSLLAHIAGVVGVEGIYDLPLLDRTFPTYRAWFMEGAFVSPSPDEPASDHPDLPERWRAASPIHLGLHPGYTGSMTQAGRILLLHSPQDELVDERQSTDFAAHLGARYVALLGPGLTHDAVLASDPFLSALRSFVQERLGS